VGNVDLCGCVSDIEVRDTEGRGLTSKINPLARCERSGDDRVRIRDGLKVIIEDRPAGLLPVRPEGSSGVRALCVGRDEWCEVWVLREAEFRVYLRKRVSKLGVEAC
jgi:hypothetical protein